MTLTAMTRRPYIGGMRHVFTLLLAASLVAAPAFTAPARAQDQGTQDQGAQEEATGEDSRSMMERGFGLFMDGLKEEMAPAMDSLRDMTARMGPAMRSFLEEMGPALADLMEEVKDWSRYEPPTILPNGDIIMRRKPDPQPEPMPMPEGGAEPAPEGTDI